MFHTTNPVIKHKAGLHHSLLWPTPSIVRDMQQIISATNTINRCFSYI